VVGGPAGIEVLSVKIVKLLNATYPPKLGVVVVLGFGMMVVLGILTVAQRKLAQRGHFKISGKNFSPRQIPLRRGRRAAQIAILTYVMVTSVIPFVGLLIVSLQPFWSPVISSLTLQNYSGLFTGSSLIGDALRRSLVLGAFAGAIGVGLCILLVSFVQDTRGFLRNATMFVVQMPAALSHIIIAIGLILAFTGRPFFLSGTAAILLIAYVLMYLPQSYAATSSAFSQMSKELVEASSVSGASRLRTLLMVEMPLAAPGMIAGWTMLFVMAISDLTASTMLASTRNAVIGSTILSLYETGTYPQLAALATLVTIISAALIAVIMRVQRRYSPF
jgi:iron(III) transport system permease protein